MRTLTKSLSISSKLLITETPSHQEANVTVKILIRPMSLFVDHCVRLPLTSSCLVATYTRKREPPAIASDLAVATNAVESNLAKQSQHDATAAPLVRSPAKCK
eukprot:2141126-Amphidinium_carterae.1